MNLLNTVKGFFKAEKTETYKEMQDTGNQKETPQKDFEDTYYIFKDYNPTSSKPNKYDQLVKTKKEWEELGFKINVTIMGQAIKKPGENFGFVRAKMEDEHIQEAIRTGKRGTANIFEVCSLVKKGATFDEFISLPKAVQYYCNASIAWGNNDYITALDYIEKCIAQKGEKEFSNWEFYYMIMYSEINGKMLKVEILENILQFFKNDIANFIYSGYFNIWLSALLKLRDFDNIPVLFSKTRIALNRIREGKSEKGFYGPFDPEILQNIIEKHELLEEKTLAKVEKQKAKTGKEITADEVAKIIYEFVQQFLANENKDFVYKPELENKLFSLCYEDKLDKNIIERLNDDEKKHLYQLLTQYIMFLTTTGKEEKFPCWFLDGKRKETIPFNILHYIAEHKWVYPQMLNS